MDNETALQLVKHGGTLLLLDVPQLTLIGIDTQMFSSGPKFKGIKMIPPGVHLVYYNSSNKDGVHFSPVIGFFADVQPSQAIVQKWDQSEERFSKLSEEEMNGVLADCFLDTAFVIISGSWRVHCVIGSRSCDCRVAIGMGELVAWK